MFSSIEINIFFLKKNEVMLTFRFSKAIIKFKINIFDKKIKHAFINFPFNIFYIQLYE